MHRIYNLTRRLKQTSISVLYSLIIFHPVLATQNEDYFIFLEAECLTTLIPDFGNVCNDAFGSSSGPGSTPAQVVSYGTSSTTVQTAITEQLDEYKEEKNAIRTAYGIGLLVSHQTADTDRDTTDLESGFESELDSNIFGIDYTINDYLLIGILSSSTDDTADIVNNGGQLQTDSDALIIYGNIVAHKNLGFDFYFGDTDNDYRSVRNYEIQNLSGTANGRYSGEQSLQGITIYSDWAFDQFTIGASFAIDSSDSDIDSYNETGTDGFEIIFPNQNIQSKLETFSINASYNFGFDWGQIIPTASYSKVKEKKNDSRNIDTSLVLSPTSSFTFRTDAPDRDYSLRSFGVNIALNNGLLLFVNQESQSGHRFIETDSMALGILYSF